MAEPLSKFDFEWLLISQLAAGTVVEGQVQREPFTDGGGTVIVSVRSAVVVLKYVRAQSREGEGEGRRGGCAEQTPPPRPDAEGGGTHGGGTPREVASPFCGPAAGEPEKAPSITHPSAGATVRDIW